MRNYTYTVCYVRTMYIYRINPEINPGYFKFFFNIF